MSDISNIVILESDSREESKALYHMRTMRYRSKLVTLIIVILIIIIMIISASSIHYIILRYIAVKSTITILNCMWFLNRVSAFRSRVTTRHFISNIVNHIVSIRGFWSSVISKEKFETCLLNEIDEEIKASKLQWNELDNKMMSWDNYNISDYWDQRGLKMNHIKSIATAIRISADEPIHPKQDYDYCLDIRERIDANHILHYMTNNWVRSNVSDDDHARSIIKRLCSPKKRIDFSAVDYQLTSMLRMMRRLPSEYKDYKDRIISALATKGSAGQFSKGSEYEEIWKNAQSKDGILIWEELIKEILLCVYVTGYLDPGIVQYMLYRKMEAIEKDASGVKPSRLMNAPNLVCRLVDSVCFSSYNDAMIKARGKIASSLGINVFVELKMIHVRDVRKVYITCDFSDYDGSQHPIQGYGVAKARILYGIIHQANEEELAYILPKYRNHMYRRVKSTSGITYDVIGQQASGDITTSDDNTSKTVGVCELYILEMIKNKMILVSNYEQPDIYEEMKLGNVGIDVTSDDSGIAVIPTEKFRKDSIKQIYDMITSKVGWQVKDSSFSIKYMGDDELEYLSHGVRDSYFKTNNGEFVLTFRCLVRPKKRSWGKFCIAPEITNILNTENRAKLLSKYLTLCMTSIGYPAMMVASFEMMLIMRSTSSPYTSTYLWAGVKAESISSIDLNDCIALQLPYTISLRFDWMYIRQDDRTEFNQFCEQLKNTWEKMIANDKRLEPLKERELVVLLNNWWNYRNTLKSIQAAFVLMDRHGLIISKPLDNKWWEEKENEIEYINISPERTGIVNYCNHDNDLHGIIGGAKTKYNCNIMCRECYKSRCEKRYDAIHICLEKAKGEWNPIEPVILKEVV